MMGGGEKLFNLRQRLMRAPAGFGSGLWTRRENRFVGDSPLEEDGFEPSVPRGMGRRYSILRHSTASSMGVLSVLTIRFGPRTAAVTDSRARWAGGQCYDGPLLSSRPEDSHLRALPDPYVKQRWRNYAGSRA